MTLKNELLQLDLRKFLAPEFVFGTDARLLAGSYCKKLGGKKILLVTDAGVSNTPWFDEMELSLREQKVDYVIYSDITPNPRDFEVMNGAAAYRDKHCNLILAVGGGSVIDCAKGIGIVSSNQSGIWKYEGVDRIGRPMPPLICVPTTSGASADVSQFAIINNIGEKYKMAIISKAVVPDLALIDPFVLTTMDSFLTACTGIDALSHAFEAYVSNASSPITDLFSLQAIQLITSHLAGSIDSPLDIQLRGKVMLGSLYAGLAFSNASLGCVHSLAHSLGGYLDLPHGECNAILLPHVVNFNFEAAKKKYETIANELGLVSIGDSNEKVREVLVDFLLQLKQKLGIRTTLRERGVTRDDIPFLAAKAIKDPCNATNPRSPQIADLEKIYSEAL